MTILAAIEADGDASTVVETGYELATAFDEPLVLVHVLTAEEFSANTGSPQDTAAIEDISIEEEREHAASRAREVLEASLAEYDEETIEVRGLVGDPAEEILGAAESIDPRYLVVGGQRRSPVGKAIFGSTTQTVLLNATCPVVTAMVE